MNIKSRLSKIEKALGVHDDKINLTAVFQWIIKNEGKNVKPPYYVSEAMKIYNEHQQKKRT